jgi:hypothetical protein
MTKGEDWGSESVGAPRDGFDSWMSRRVAIPRPTPELAPVMRMYRRGSEEDESDMLWVEEAGERMNPGLKLKGGRGELTRLVRDRHRNQPVVLTPSRHQHPSRYAHASQASMYDAERVKNIWRESRREMHGDRVQAAA